MRAAKMMSYFICLLAVIQALEAQEPVDNHTGFVPDELIVQFVPGTPLSVRATLFNQVDALQTRQLEFIETTHVVDFPRNSNLDRLIDALQRNPNVQMVARNAILQLSPRFPNDLHSQQWNMHNTGQTGGTADVDIDAPEAWDFSTGSTSVKVAVIDTGVDTDHWDLAGNLLPGWNVVDDNANVEETAANSHGTAIAGIIAAVGNNGFDGNGRGAVGVTWRTKILPVLFCDLSGWPPRGCTDADMADGVQFARNNGAKIINISANSTVNLVLTRQQMQQAAAQDVLFVFSAGNSGDYGWQGINVDVAGPGTNRYPCQYTDANLICVAAVNDVGNKPLFSNFGVQSIDLGAPGEDIYSTVNGNTHDEPGPACCHFPDGTGTSYAAPHVSGILCQCDDCLEVGEFICEIGQRP